MPQSLVTNLNTPDFWYVKHSCPCKINIDDKLKNDYFYRKAFRKYTLSATMKPYLW